MRCAAHSGLRSSTRRGASARLPRKIHCNAAMARGLQARWGTTGRCHGAQRSALRHMRAVAGAAAVNPGTVLPTPHSGYHWDGLPRRFFEGWYFKVTIPETGQSFALIFSVEDPHNSGGPLSGVGVQVMGPDDGYICQFSPDTSSFWASRNVLELGASLRAQPGSTAAPPRRPVSQAEFDARVQQGFQASSSWHQGTVVAAEAGAAGPQMSTVQRCSWAFSMQPKVSWGDAPHAPGRSSSRSQVATAGWLSLLPIFEPHWQVLMAEGAASGWLKWGDTVHEFHNAPAYAEKNWGGGFPSKWLWVQCNTFDVPGLSVTAVGARRQLALGLAGAEEDVGMLGIHMPDGSFLELVPWAGEVEWSADPWGRWWLRGAGRGYEAELEATCLQQAGAVLRAPTASGGLAPHCRDTFFGRARLRVWRAEGPGGRRRAGAAPIVDATSTTAALEVGGGPWWAPWSARAAMLEPLRSLVQLPIDAGELARQLPDVLKPPGL